MEEEVNYSEQTVVDWSSPRKTDCEVRIGNWYKEVNKGRGVYRGIQRYKCVYWCKQVYIGVYTFLFVGEILASG